MLVAPPQVHGHVAEPIAVDDAKSRTRVRHRSVQLCSSCGAERLVVDDGVDCTFAKGDADVCWLERRARERRGGEQILGSTAFSRWRRRRRARRAKRRVDVGKLDLGALVGRQHLVQRGGRVDGQQRLAQRCRAGPAAACRHVARVKRAGSARCRCTSRLDGVLSRHLEPLLTLMRLARLAIDCVGRALVVGRLGRLDEIGKRHVARRRLARRNVLGQQRFQLGAVEEAGDRLILGHGQVVGVERECQLSARRRRKRTLLLLAAQAVAATVRACRRGREQCPHPLLKVRRARPVCRSGYDLVQKSRPLRRRAKRRRAQRVVRGRRRVIEQMCRRAALRWRQFLKQAHPRARRRDRQLVRPRRFACRRRIASRSVGPSLIGALVERVVVATAIGCCLLRLQNFGNVAERGGRLLCRLGALELDAAQSPRIGAVLGAGHQQVGRVRTALGVVERVRCALDV